MFLLYLHFIQLCVHHPVYPINGEIQFVACDIWSGEFPLRCHSTYGVDLSHVDLKVVSSVIFGPSTPSSAASWSIQTSIKGKVLIIVWAWWHPSVRYLIYVSHSHRSTSQDWEYSQGFKSANRERDEYALNKSTYQNLYRNQTFLSTFKLWSGRYGEN